MYQSGGILAGTYRLQRPLDKGGMHRVWLARHEAFDMPVAIKIGKPVRSRGLEPLAARRVAKLLHTSIVTPLASGVTERGDPFVVMEYLAGSSLSDVLARDGRLSARAAVKLLLPVLEALSLCHAGGVVHGHVKPSRIFLARHRGVTHAKLLDAGAARLPDAHRTEGRFAETPGYTAPEQLQRAAQIDHRHDLWAFCAVLYEAIAGRPAVEADAGRAFVAANAEPSIGLLQEPIAAGLWPILQRGLSKEAVGYQSAGELYDALAAWLERAAQSPAGREDEPSGVRLRYPGQAVRKGGASQAPAT